MQLPNYQLPNYPITSPPTTGPLALLSGCANSNIDKSPTPVYTFSMNFLLLVSPAGMVISMMRMMMDMRHRVRERAVLRRRYA